MFFLKELPTREILERYGSRFPGMNVESVEQALHLLRRASLLLRAIEAYFAEHGLSQTQFLVLIVLDREADDGGLFPSEIAERLDVSRPVVSDIIRALAKRKLIQSSGSTADRRAKLIRLTSAGRSQLEGILPGYYATIAKHHRPD